MKSFLLFSLFFVSAACAQTEPLKTLALTIRPGEARWLEFPLGKAGPEAKLICRESQDVKFVRKGEVGFAFIIESYFSQLKPFSCQLVAEGNVFTRISFTVEDREYPAEQLKVDPKKIKLSPQAEKRVIKEQKMLNALYASSVSEFRFTEAFMQPINSHVTSIYGTKRVYNKRKKGQHLGIDYRAAIGDKVPAANAGKVVFAGDLFYTGWTVIIDHGLDIFTVYGHLSKTLVKAGEMVKRGQIVALSGNTGRTSGPHLHWGVKVQGQYIDGMVLIEESKKFFRH